jgi:hypothetical protein
MGAKTWHAVCIIKLFIAYLYRFYFGHLFSRSEPYQCQMMKSKMDTYSLEEKVELATKLQKFLNVEPVKELMTLAITMINNNDQPLTKRTKIEEKTEN